MGYLHDIAFADNDNDGKDELYIGEASKTLLYYKSYKYRNGVFGTDKSNDINMGLSSDEFAERESLCNFGDF